MQTASGVGYSTHIGLAAARDTRPEPILRGFTAVVLS